VHATAYDAGTEGNGFHTPGETDEEGFDALAPARCDRNGPVACIEHTRPDGRR
jgi:hypothetical protein